MEWKARDEYDYKEPKAPLSEAWVLAKKLERRLCVWERKLLRKIYGPISDGQWKIRRNEEFRVLYDEPDIISIIKNRRLRWLGHVEEIGYQGSSFLKSQRVPEDVGVLV